MTKAQEASQALDETRRRELAAEADSEAGRKTLAQIQAINAGGINPEPCNALDLTYAAYMTPYLGQDGAPVLTLLAQGMYYPTPGAVKMYFEGVYGNPNAYKLMQVNSVDVFYLATYHAASYSSGAGLLDLGDTVTVEDAYGQHQVPVLPWT